MKFTNLALVLMLFPVVGHAGSITYVTGSGSIVPGTVDVGNHCDDCTTAITLPFTYALYGTSYTTAFVSSNGALEFGSNSAGAGPLPMPIAAFDHTILAYWGDLDTSDSASGQGVFTSISGSGPNRIFNIEWRAKECCVPGAPTENFEIRLYEGTNHFDLAYGNLTNYGDYQTVGVEMNSTDYTQFETTTRGAITTGLMLGFGGSQSTTVPEPGSVGMLVGGCAGLLFRRVRRRAA